MPISPPNVDSEDEVIDKLWSDASVQIMSIDPANENWKAQVLPLARIKKIMKSEEAIHSADHQSASSSTYQRFMIAGEAPVLLEKACELLVRDLTVRAWRHTERCRRRTLQRQDVHAAVGENEVYDFLIDIVPRITPQAGNKSFPTGTSLEQSQMRGSAMNFETASNVPSVIGAQPKNEPGMSLADAELRLAQLQQMQEQFILMQQRMHAEAVVGGGVIPVSQNQPQTPQVMSFPTMYMPTQTQAIPSVGISQLNNVGQNMVNGTGHDLQSVNENLAGST